MINAERIAEMKRLSAEATPGPWEVEESRYDGKYNAASVDENYDLPACLMRHNDAMLVTESRQFVPDIIVAYEETKKQSAFWYEQFVNMTDAHAEQAEEIAKLRKALEYYAEIGNYIVQGEGHLASSIVDDDLGASARDALK